MKRFTQAWLIALAVKTVIAIWLPLSNDESYYWVWGHHPGLSYFDHPPMVGWLFWIGTFFESLGNAARLPGVWLGHLTLLIWNKLLEPFLDEKKKMLWFIFILASPFFSAGSLIVTPDIPLLFFWSLSLLILLELVKGKKWAYPALGAALGLGFCSKYMIVLFVPIALAWLAFSGEWRKIRWALVPVTIVTGLLFCTPVLYWNYTHEWASFVFQINHGFESEKYKAWWPLEYLGGQLLILFPPLAWLATRRREPKEAKYLHFFGWLPLAFFFYSSFKAHVEANWPMMGHPAILALAFLNMPDWKWLKASVAIWVLALLLVLSEIAMPWVPIDKRRLKTSEYKRFDVYLPHIAKAEREGIPFYLGSYQMAGNLSYKLRRQIYKLGGMNRRDFYDFTPQSFPNGDKFLVGAEIYHPLPEWLTAKGYVLKNTEILNSEFVILEVERRAQGSDR